MLTDNPVNNLSRDFRFTAFIVFHVTIQILLFSLGAIYGYCWPCWPLSRRLGIARVHLQSCFVNISEVYSNFLTTIIRLVDLCHLSKCFYISISPGATHRNKLTMAMLLFWSKKRGFIDVTMTFPPYKVILHLKRFFLNKFPLSCVHSPTCGLSILRRSINDCIVT